MGKVYVTIDGKEYQNYEFYTVGYDRVVIHSDYFISDEFEKRIIGDAKKVIEASTYIPQTGQKCFAIPPSSVPFSDLRKEYTVKRKIEDADFVVFPTNEIFSYRYWFKQFIVVESEKKIYGLKDDAKELSFIPTIISHADPNILNKLSDCSAFLYTKQDYVWSLLRYDYNKLKYFIEFFLGYIKKPVVAYDKLTFSGKNEMDIDSLLLLYKLGCEDWSDDSRKNFIIQLQALNQTDWRNHIGATRLVLDTCMSQKDKTGVNVLERISILPKDARELVKTVRNHPISFDSEEDARVGRAFTEKFLGFDPAKYSSLQEISAIIALNKYPYAYFYELYDNIIKFKPKCIEK